MKKKEKKKKRNNNRDKRWRMGERKKRIKRQHSGKHRKHRV